MRIIDADYVTEKLNEINGTAELDKAFEVVENAPTVDVLDKIRAEIGKSKTEHEMQIAEKDIKAKLLISNIYCDIVNILDKQVAESEDN